MSNPCGESPEAVAFKLYDRLSGIEDMTTIDEHLALYKKCLLAVKKPSDFKPGPL